MKHTMKRTLCPQWNLLVGWSQHMKGQDGFSEVSVNPSQEAETWASSGIPTRQRSHTHLKVHQGLVSEEVLEEFRVTVTVSWLDYHKKSLVRVEKGVAAHKPKDISELWTRNRLRFNRNNARSWFRAVHFMFSRSEPLKGLTLSAQNACNGGVE